MKIIQKILLLAVLFSGSSIYSIPTKNKTINVTESKSKSSYRHYSSGASYYYGFDGLFDIGQYYENPIIGDTERRIYVSGYYFSLSQLPPEEYIISCKLRVILEDVQGGSFTAHVKQLPTSAFSNDSEEVFNEIYDATKLFEFDYPDTSDYNITSNVIANISDGFIKFGVSQNPNTSYASIKRANVKSIQIIVKYYEYYNLVAKNNMGIYEDGDIYVGKNNPVNEEDSPFEFTAKETDNINLKAKENQNNGGYSWIWNDEAETPLNKSEWKKKKGNDFDPISPSQSATYEVELSDDDAELIGYLKKICNYSVNHNFGELGIIENDIYNSTIVDGNLVTVSVDATKPSPSGITGVFGGWEGIEVTSNPLSTIVTEHTDFTAIYKAVGYSNNSAAYSNNSQPKFVRSANGDLWNLYESMGSTWLERSSDNGSTWDLANEYSPNFPQFPSIFTDSNMKNASLCLSPDGDKIGVAYQKYDEYENKNRIHIALYKIEATNLLESLGSYTIQGDVYGNDYIANNDASPVISSEGDDYSDIQFYHVAWVGNNNGYLPGIYYACFIYSPSEPNPILELESIQNIPNTDINSQNPAIISSSIDLEILAHLVWQQGTSEIRYSSIDVNSGWSGYDCVIANYAIPSSGSGYTTNTSPSISVLSDGKPVVAWDGGSKIITRKREASAWSSTFSYYGTNNPAYPQVRIVGSEATIAWSEDNSKLKLARGSNLWSFATSGNYVQFADAPNLDAMYCSVFKTTAQPYYFTTTNKDDLNSILPTTITSNTIVSGNITVSSNTTVNSGVILTIEPGTNITFQNGSSLIVNDNATLDVNGTSANKITFDFITQNSTLKNGIKIYPGGTANIENAIIKNAYNGIYVNQGLLNIDNSEIFNCYYSVHLYRTNYVTGTYITNTHSHNNEFGIVMYYSRAYLSNNELDYNWIGLGCADYSSPYLSGGSCGYNDIHDNDIGVYAFGYSNPFLGRETCTSLGGHNIIENNTYYEFQTHTNCNIYAETNWWGTSSPSSSQFMIGSGCTLDYTPYLTSSPQLEQGIQITPEEEEFNNKFTPQVISSVNSTAPLSLATTTNNKTGYNKTWPIEWKLLYARNLIRVKNYNAAADICESVITDFPDSARSYLALDLLWESRKDGKKTLFKQYVKNKAKLKTKKQLHGAAELLLAVGEKENRIAILDEIEAKYKDTPLVEHILFQKFMYYLYEENNTELAKGLSDELLALFPNSESYYASQRHLGNDVRKPLAPQLAKGNLEEVTLEIPKNYELLGNYPNPFNPSTTISYALPYSSNVEITIYDITGKVVKVFNENGQTAGYQNIVWFGNNQQGSRVSSGVYFYRFKATSTSLSTSTSLDGSRKVFEKTAKLLLLK